MPDAAELKAMLLGQHLVQTDCAELIANITEVMVMPQPYGTVYAHLLTETGEVNEYHTFMRTGVVDVGTYTVDLALDEDGEFKDAESGSVESGVFTAQERTPPVERDHRQKIPTASSSVLRTGVFLANGKTMDYSAEVEEAWPRCARPNLIGGSGNAAQRGGDLPLGRRRRMVCEQVAEAYPQTQLVTNAQLANARGYLNYAHFIARQEAV
jgi:hypothetical protein